MNFLNYTWHIIACSHINTGLEIPDRLVANAMRNGEGLQLIPNTVVRLAIIFSQHNMSKLHVFTISRDVENGKQVRDSMQVGSHFVLCHGDSSHHL